MKSIGGYFELELRKGEEYHQEVIRLNTGRNALEFILRSRKYTNVFIPNYTCDVILEPLNKLGVSFEYYSIDDNFEPVFNYTRIKANEGFLYTNYFGLKDNFVYKLPDYCMNLIIDNSQAFFSKPALGIDTFNSVRKFFGVPDGAYLYLEGADASDFPLDRSLNRFAHLLKSIECGPESGYNDFKINEHNLIGQPIMQMSNLTRALLCNIDYEYVKKRRRENFFSLHEKLLKYNEINLIPDKDSTPMVYPFVFNKIGLRKFLIKNKIFIAHYWTNVLDWIPDKKSIENYYSTMLFPLPINQNLSKGDVDCISKIVLRAIKET